MSGGRSGDAAKMESVALVAPVTALEFVGDVVLAGEPRGADGAGGGGGDDGGG